VEKSHRDQQRDFRNALVSNLDLLRVFEAVEAARLEQLRAAYDVHRARLRLLLATGSLPVPPTRP
jgi:outer membrane protein TolC